MGLSPHEVLMGRPLSLPTSPVTSQLVDIHLADDVVLDYYKSFKKCVKSFHSQVAAALSKEITQPCHKLQPGDWVHI